jgi:hypothetical protein
MIDPGIYEWLSITAMRQKCSRSDIINDALQNLKDADEERHSSQVA